MANTILCTIDLSEASKPVLQWAVTMAQQMKVHLTILYTYRLLHYRNGEALQLKKQAESDAQEHFKMLEKEFINGKGISYDFRTEVGFVSDRIEDHAKKNKLNFLIMNKNISTNSKENFEDIVEHIKVPLLLVP